MFCRSLLVCDVISDSCYDIVVLPSWCRCSHHSPSQLLQCHQETDGLKLHQTKPSYGATHGLWSRQQLTHVHTTLVQQLPGTIIALLASIRNFGVVFDNVMSVANLVTSVMSSCFYLLKQLRVIRPSLTIDTVTTLVLALVASRVVYCNGLLFYC